MPRPPLRPSPDRPTIGGPAATVKRDGSLTRAGRFAETWRRLRRDGATHALVEHLHRADLLLPATRQ